MAPSLGTSLGWDWGCLVNCSNSEETFRGTMQGRTPDGEPTTLIVTRRGLGRNGRTWLTFDGAIKTTAVMTDQEIAQLIALLGAATGGQ